MRENASKTALFLLSVALLVPVASARPAKPTHAAAARKPVHSAQPVRIAPHARGKEIPTPEKTEKSEERRGSRSSAHFSERDISERNVPEPRGKSRFDNKHPVSDRRSEARFVETRRGLSRSVKEGHLHERSEDRVDERYAESKSRGKRRSAPVEEARVQPRSAFRKGSRITPPSEVRVEARAEASTPEAAAVELPPIEVHHNRKVHLTPENAAPEPAAAPRKATVQDFLDSPATPVAPADPDTSAAPSGDAAPAARPAGVAAARHPVSVVERRLPVVKPVPVIVPDPVIEPVLYSSGGRLIVPPAMKGSHEILVHQNEMADQDGLARIQNDADLERLRAAKQLVALPVSEELGVDERLPVNRRYCRPWTAQFLAAMARAHYARFHTPLQVNSAVRTVEFQERLRYSNGNAAPAEGETASPHLTGQAVDLAKHGLSMTEIAWMRGYLMPLVQQGKIDVEEEFQQSCFHISVYKKYTPQAAPRRDIPTRRSPANALAAALQ